MQVVIIIKINWKVCSAHMNYASAVSHETWQKQDDLEVVFDLGIYLFYKLADHILEMSGLGIFYEHYVFRKIKF